MIPATVLNVSEARDRLSDLMGRAFYRNETFVIARKGTPMVVLISIEEYNALQAARSERAVDYDVGHYEMQVKEWAEQYEAARATLETQHPALDQEEAERVELTALLDELEHPQVLPPLDDVAEIDGADFLTTDKVQDWLKGVEVRPEEVSELKGFAASAGVTEGPARVLKLLEEIVTLQPGEIMVAPNTNPAWAPVFSKIKAAVTDIGGLTSHAAIVCREYGLPSVTGTGTATSVIKTGDIIKVDGDRGIVTIVKRASS